MSKPWKIGEFAMDHFSNQHPPESTQENCTACGRSMHTNGGSTYFKRDTSTGPLLFNGELITICSDCLGSASRLYPAKHRAGDPICLTTTNQQKSPSP